MGVTSAVGVRHRHGGAGVGYAAAGAEKCSSRDYITRILRIYIYIKNTNWYAHTCISARSLHTNSCRTVAFTFYVHNNDTINAIKIIASSLLAVKKINFTLK